MSRRKTRRKAGNAKQRGSEDGEQVELAVELAELEPVLAAELTPGTTQVKEKMSDLKAVLREIREFRRETAEGINGIREDLRTTNDRIDEAERRIGDTEERVLSIEEAACELIKLHRKVEEKQIDQEGRARRENIRLHGMKEGAEKDAESVGAFVEALLREKLELSPVYQLSLERAHRMMHRQDL